jgi:ABC-type nitrate/sulfonate/bicarbonate transport system permease component
MSRAARVWIPAAFFVAVLALWELAARRAGTGDLVPLPSGVAAAAARTIGDGTLAAATAGSFGRVLFGFTAAALLGIPLGLLMGLAAPVDRSLRPVVDSFRSIAPIAWIPLAILWFGVRGSAALFVVTYAAFFPFVLNTIEAVRSVDPRLVEAARAFGARPWLRLRAVIAPSILPVVLVGARVAMAFAWASIIAAELAIGIKITQGSSAAVGLGQLMIDTLYVRRDVNALVLYMLVVGVIALAIDFGMRRALALAAPWSRR